MRVWEVQVVVWKYGILRMLWADGRGPIEGGREGVGVGEVEGLVENVTFCRHGNCSLKCMRISILHNVFKSSKPDTPYSSTNPLTG